MAPTPSKVGRSPFVPVEDTMKYLLMVYNDDSMLSALTQSEFDTRMCVCIKHADELRAQGQLLDTQQLEAPSTAKTVRIRNGGVTVVDGPFAETKEYLGGFNLIEAADMDEAIKIAMAFPWTRTGSVEIRPVRDFEAVRRRVGA
jgi:hypothetical protein